MGTRALLAGLGLAVFTAVHTIFAATPAPALAQGGGPAGSAALEPEVVPGEVVIRFRPGAGRGGADAVARAHGLSKVRDLDGRDAGGGAGGGLDIKRYRFAVSAKEDGRAKAKDLAQRLARDPRVLYAEPNYVVRACDTFPDDPRFQDLWGLHNTGQASGTADADIDAPEAWSLTTGGSSLIVAVIDTGIDTTHPDLAANLWVNPNEIAGNGIDDDANGYIDDIHGINAITGTGNPMDDHGHGTHVAGTIGGVGNNAVGVAGVNWDVKLIGVKFLGSTGSGSTADATEALLYLNRLKHVDGHDIRITNNSWGGGGYSQALVDAFNALDQPGMEPMLHACAAGNANHDNDLSPFYPGAYDNENIISVAATDRNDLYASFSSYGRSKTDLAAPGVAIWSTVPTGVCSLCDASGYRSLNGTSMATPHVAGAAALVASSFPSATAAELKSRLMYGADPIGHLGTNAAKPTVTDARLNVFGAMDDDTVPPGAIEDLAASEVRMASATLAWTASGDDGSAGAAKGYDVRYATAPITEATWASATQAAGEPAPLAAGAAQSLVVRGLLPEAAYFFAMRATDNVGNASALSNVAAVTTVGPTDVVFDDDMENGSSQWYKWANDHTYPGLWHLSARRAVSPTNAWYYGDEATGNVATGTLNNSGWVSFLTHRQLGREATMVLDYWLDADPQDRFTLYMSANDELTVTKLLKTFAPTGGQWATAQIDLSTIFGGDPVVAQFNFNHLGIAAAGEGAYIDNVRILSYKEESVPPAAVTTLAAAPKLTSVTLTFLAPGDDGNVGTAAKYDIRYGTGLLSEANWHGGSRVVNEAKPKPPGSLETFKVSSLYPGTVYYFAVKTRDEDGNWSPISNVVQTTTSSGSVVFEDDMEAGETKWTKYGAFNLSPATPSLWHLTSARASTPAQSFLYGSETGPVSTPTKGVLIVSEPVALGSESVLTFDEWLGTSPARNADVYVSTNDGLTWLYFLNSAPGQAAWVGNSVFLTTSTNLEVLFLFFFAHTLELPAADAGWYVDNVRVVTHRVDLTPPSAPWDLAVASEKLSAATVTWRAGGDDGDVGGARGYDLRYSTVPITAASFAAASRIRNEPLPSVYGTTQQATITGLRPNTTYYVAIRARDEDGNWSPISNVVAARTKGGTPIFEDDVESGGGAWITEGTPNPPLWHIAERRAASATHAWWYGQDGPPPNYDTGLANRGGLELAAPIDMAGLSDVVLTFKEWSHFESPRPQDVARVLVWAEGSSVKFVLFEAFGTGAWMERSVDLLPTNPNWTAPVNVAFNFDTIDATGNGAEGWYVDDVRVLVPAPLTADFAAPGAACAGEPVAFEDLSNGHLGSWLWDFGDGSFSTAEDPTHVYAAEGTYTVTLTVTSRSGIEQDTATRSIAVAPALVADFAAAPASGLAPLAVSFTDLSAGAPTSWLWDFGDGATSTAQHPSHAYAAPGVYTVRLTASTSCGADTVDRVDLIAVGGPVTAAFASPSDACSGTAVAFADQSTGPVAGWQWDFGDGASSTAPSPSHAYAAAGTYGVTLTVTGVAGLTSDAETRSIAVDAPVVVAFNGTPLSGVVPLTVAFTDQSAGVPESWSWTFGDGTTSTARNPVKTYAARGTYTVRLDATNACGTQSLTKTAYVTVSGSARVTSITYTRLFGKTYRISLTVRDELNQPISGATVSIRVNRGSTVVGNFNGTTSSSGVANITVNLNQSGCYTTTVTNVVKSGFVWDGVTPTNQLCR